MKYKKILVYLLVVFIIMFSFSFCSSAGSFSLMGKVITIDVGHGGRDSGTSYGNIYEKDLNLALSKKLKDFLIEQGAIVYMTREDDTDLSSVYDESKKRGDLYRRIMMIKDNKSDIYLSIHMNWFDDPKYGGIEVRYNKINERNILLANSLINAFDKKGMNIRQLKEINDYIYRNTTNTGVLIECGFLSNPNDRYLLQQEYYQNQLAKAITEGVINYFSL